jgi:hypothetical protein
MGKRPCQNKDHENKYYDCKRQDNQIGFPKKTNNSSREREESVIGLMSV